MKQKKLIAAVGAAVVLGFGGATAQAADNFTGPYVGGSLSLFNNTTVSLSDSAVNADGDVVSETVNLGVDDAFNQLDLVFGYGALLNSRAYVGAEFRYTVADRFKGKVLNFASDADAGSFDIEGDGGYALMFQLGYAVTDNVVFYGTAGYVKREWDVSFSGVFEGTAEREEVSFKTSGIGYGIGVKYAFSRNLLVNAEVLKANYSSKTVIDEGVFDDAIGNAASLEPDSLSASVGIMYRF